MVLNFWGLPNIVRRAWRRKNTKPADTYSSGGLVTDRSIGRQNQSSLIKRELSSQLLKCLLDQSSLIRPNPLIPLIFLQKGANMSENLYSKEKRTDNKLLIQVVISSLNVECTRNNNKQVLVSWSNESLLLKMIDFDWTPHSAPGFFKLTRSVFVVCSL
jgi:hypothetical protein